jgi:hypothetical protein
MRMENHTSEAVTVALAMGLSLRVGADMAAFHDL